MCWGLWGLQWWILLFAGFGICVALGDPLAFPAFHQGALEEACGLTSAHSSLCLECPVPPAPGSIPAKEGAALHLGLWPLSQGRLLPQG